MGFQPGPTHNGLYNHRGLLEALNLGFRRYGDCTINVAKTKVLQGYRDAGLPCFRISISRSPHDGIHIIQFLVLFAASINLSVNDGFLYWPVNMT